MDSKATEQRFEPNAFYERLLAMQKRGKSADGSDMIVAGGSDNSGVQASVPGTVSTIKAVGGKWYTVATDGVNFGFQP